MLVTCPSCQSPVFARSSAVEEGRAQRCFACNAQLIVKADGSATLLAEAPATATPAAPRPAAPGPIVPPPVSGVFGPGGAALDAATPAPIDRGGDPASGPRPVSIAGIDTSSLRAAPPPRADDVSPSGPKPVSLTDLEAQRAPPALVTGETTPPAPPLSLALELDVGFPEQGPLPVAAKLPWEPSQEGEPIVPPPSAALTPRATWAPDDGPPPPRIHDEPEEDLFARPGASLEVLTDEGDALEGHEPPLPFGSQPPSGLDETHLEEIEPVAAAPAQAAASRSDDGKAGERSPRRGGPGRPRYVAAALAAGTVVGLAAAVLMTGATSLPPLEQKVADASALIGEGQPVEAARLLEEVLAAAPDHPAATLHLARAATLSGDTLIAERHYLRWLTLAPADDEQRRAVRSHLGLDDDR